MPSRGGNITTSEGRMEGQETEKATGLQKGRNREQVRKKNIQGRKGERERPS